MNTRESGKASSSLGLQDFDLLRVIGRGSYAKVLLVRLKKTDRIYAMKVVKKELVNDDEVSTMMFYILLQITFSIFVTFIWLFNISTLCWLHLKELRSRVNYSVCAKKSTETW